ncbi:MAG: BatA and WFA domain-containing protein [Bryobacteraceae bacterium]
MFFFNLSAAEFLGLFAAASAVVVALYLLDRSRRQVVVSTLRFWTKASRPVESTRRRRITQWPSLLLQLLSIACLLLALSQLRLGSRDMSSRDHVLILDTSSWMAARGGGGRTLMEETRAVAQQYLNNLSRGDRVLVMYADALATPVTAFETSRKNAREAVARAQAGSSALDLQGALDYAVGLQKRENKVAGEIVYAGAGRVTAGEGGIHAPANLRVLPVAANPSNAGLRKIGVRRSTQDGGLWRVFVSVRNYNRRPQPVDLAVTFAASPVATRRLNMAAMAEEEVVFDFRTRVAGVMEARIRARGDGFPGDDRATLQLPASPLVPVTVCSTDPRALRPLLDAHPNVAAKYLSPSQCEGTIEEGIAIFDRCAPRVSAKIPAMYLAPPPTGSPVPVRRQAPEAEFRTWNRDHPLAAGLRAQDLRLGAPEVLSPAAGDAVVAESSAGPLIVARPGSANGTARIVAFGFHPVHAGLKFELAAPLLFANAIRWLAPDSFRRFELFANSTGMVQAPMERDAGAGEVRVVGEDGVPLPFSVRDNTIRFFSASPGTVRVAAGDQEQVHSLTLPAVPDDLWQPSAGIKRGVPRRGESGSPYSDIWYWLALAGGLGLLLEWLWYAPRGRRLVGHALSSGDGEAALRKAS